MSDLKGNAQGVVRELVHDLEKFPERSNGDHRAGVLARLTVAPEALRALPADFVKRHRVLPFEINRGIIHIATADPGNQRVIDDIRLLSGLEVRESQAPSPEILQ